MGFYVQCIGGLVLFVQCTYCNFWQLVVIWRQRCDKTHETLTRCLIQCPGWKKCKSQKSTVSWTDSNSCFFFVFNFPTFFVTLFAIVGQTTKQHAKTPWSSSNSAEAAHSQTDCVLVYNYTWQCWLEVPWTLFLHNKVITDYVRPDYAVRLQQEKPYILVFMWKTETHR